jgi:hypothetical protein
MASLQSLPSDTRDRYLAGATLMLKRYGDKALEESARRADELAADGDRDGTASLRINQRRCASSPTHARRARPDRRYGEVGLDQPERVTS